MCETATKSLYQVIQQNGEIWVGKHFMHFGDAPIIKGIMKVDMIHVNKATKERILIQEAQLLVNLANETLLLRKQSHE